MTEEIKYVVEVDCTTGESITRPMTDEELEAHAKMAEESIKRQAEVEATEKAKAEATASAIAKLAKLGLTEEEAKAIAG